MSTDKKKKRRELIHRAKHLERESRNLARKYKKKLSEESHSGLVEQSTKLAEMLKDAKSESLDTKALEKLCRELDSKLEQHLGHARKTSTRETIESIMWAVVIALLIRAFIVEAFKIPSGSMIPTLKVGDHIFVNKFVFGVRIPFTNYKLFTWRNPKRGEVIVFEFPGDPREPENSDSIGKDFIKRVVAIPGDRLKIISNKLYLNGKLVSTDTPKEISCGDLTKDDLQNPDCRGEDACYLAESTLDDTKFQFQYRIDPHRGGCRVNTPNFPIMEHWNKFRNKTEITVPKGHVFVMGDNRDNSRDSRYWGFVPFNVIKGKALIVWWSKDPTVGWFSGIRWGRLFSLIH